MVWQENGYRHHLPAVLYFGANAIFQSKKGMLA